MTLEDTPAASLPSPEDTLMYQEAGEAGAAVAAFLAANGDALSRIAQRLRASPPAVIVTCARGSSDHAATYGKYLFETLLGIPTASAALSVASVYAAPVAHGEILCLAISQSGRSPDLLAAVEAQRAAGAFVVALVNDETSPLAAMADETLPLKAGAERSVAATKSYIASLAGLAALAGHWAGDEALLAALGDLPLQLPAAFAADWTPALAGLTQATNLFLLGRGYSYGIAQEAALKLKETSGLHAESFSAAEVRHGPMAIVGEGFPVISFATSDDTGDDVRAVTQAFAERGARINLADASGTDPRGNLPTRKTHPAIEPILMIQSFYKLANALALARSFNPDVPPYLKKVTQTL
jgi:glucosamine--fructose-6-phosphate aminotransferase (isomerizing)